MVGVLGCVAVRLLDDWIVAARTLGEASSRSVLRGAETGMPPIPKGGIGPPNPWVCSEGRVHPVYSGFRGQIWDFFR